ncbi:MAG: hypothetical protein ABFD63_07425 [Smithella sp.]|jgi:hypothetical protein
MSKIGDLLFMRKHHVCPRWLCFTFDNRIRRLLQDPDRIMNSFIQPGDFFESCRFVNKTINHLAASYGELTLVPRERD